MTEPSGSWMYAPSSRGSTSGASAAAVSSDGAVAPRDERRAADAGAGEGAEPQRQLDDRAVDAHPLRLGVVRDAGRGRSPGPSFMPSGRLAARPNAQSSDGE